MPSLLPEVHSNTWGTFVEKVEYVFSELGGLVAETPFSISVLIIGIGVYGGYNLWSSMRGSRKSKGWAGILEKNDIKNYDGQGRLKILNWEKIEQLKLGDLHELIICDEFSDDCTSRLKELLMHKEETGLAKKTEINSLTSAIHLKNVTKIYKLHGSQRDQLIDVLGLNRLGIKIGGGAKEFVALNNISLDVSRGHRIGIVGRNGAGKTTLLKLLCGNFMPTEGVVTVNGMVQALMGAGLGFHPDYTGRENIEASLQYNGLKKAEYDEAIKSIIDFCELGDFLDQPFKIYSLGMQARLMFAAATAIKPDILIVDEVMGAGDAYFVAKSKVRIDKLVSSGCTMLLVSHSMQQVLELCDEAIWLDQGQIRMKGESFLVVKAYEEYLHGPVQKLSMPKLVGATELSDDDVGKLIKLKTMKDSFSSPNTSRPKGLQENMLLQEPWFIPHAEVPDLPYSDAQGFHYVAAGGISRWEPEQGEKEVGFSVITERGLSDTLIALRPAKFIITIAAESDGLFNCRYGIAINDHLGGCVTRIYSPCDQFKIKAGDVHRIELLLNPCQIGPGEYTVGISVIEFTEFENINSAVRYDLLSRSFSIRVELPGSLAALNAGFFHTSEWQFEDKVIHEKSYIQ